jgi:DnaK suppressor protein
MVSSAGDQTWFEGMRQRLLAQKEQLERQLSDLRSAVQAESQYQDEEGPASNHPADGASDLLAAEIDATIARTLEEELSAVVAALARLDDGSYGVCVDCGQPIERARLEAIPWAPRCIPDQERRESTRAQRRT